MKRLLITLMAVALLSSGIFGCSKPQLTLEHKDIIFACEGLCDGFYEKGYRDFEAILMIAGKEGTSLTPIFDLLASESSGVVSEIVLKRYSANIFLYKDEEGFVLAITDRTVGIQVICTGEGLNDDPDFNPAKIAETILARLSKYSY